MNLDFLKTVYEEKGDVDVVVKWDVIDGGTLGAAILCRVCKGDKELSGHVCQACNGQGEMLRPYVAPASEVPNGTSH